MLAQDFYRLIDKIAPFSLALEWDNSGFQVGDPQQEVKKVAFALDPTLAVIQKAIFLRANLLICHHPLIFKPLKNIIFPNPVYHALTLALENKLTILSAHTNWDAVGVHFALAGLLELKPLGFLEPTSPKLLKLVVFVPPEYFSKVSQALFQAGAGTIGDYTSCSFRAQGLGSFLPPPDGKPFIGNTNEYTETPELRLEVILPESLAFACVEAIKLSHPYEEPAFEFYPCTTYSQSGFGLVGLWEPPREPIKFVSKKLALPELPHAGPIPLKVTKVVLCPGSGASYVESAKRSGADILITGDLTHHHALAAKELGIGVLDAGHFHTERPGMLYLQEKISHALKSQFKDPGISPETDFYFINDEPPLNFTKPHPQA
ncbi:MAG: Nif3-like dinuclear metal center hexameric protein [Deltaproteobacteria bacterium]|jgi:dinuclear metal center YbgI/SA1388 family protein|nr:Nif3-like dinuclear metal center hexameric protein [Deltaproteobacteria bacterium]